VNRFLDATAQARSLDETAHRPWPVKQEPWLMGQTWQNLLFAHWRVPHDALRPHVPDALQLEQHDGSAWIGLTPFRVAGLRIRGVPPLPLLSSFLELNCRTYVRHGDRPGIWFFSLDAARAAAATAARLTYQLPYRHARMAIARAGSRIEYRSRARTAHAVLRAAYEPTGPATHPAPGTLEHFLTERYCLYTVDRHARLRRADIHHPPWALQPAGAELAENTMTEPFEIHLPAQQPLLHYAARQDVLVWPLVPGTAGVLPHRGRQKA
jgi:uncharacterized protein